MSAENRDRKELVHKNLGRLQHAHIRNSGRLYELQLIPVDSGYFTQSDLSGPAMVPIIIKFGNRHI